MLKKRDLKSFYTDIFVLNNIFKTVSNNNRKLEEGLTKNMPSSLSIETNKKELAYKDINEPEKKFILRAIKEHRIFEIVVELFEDMHEYDFSSTPSVRNATIEGHISSYSRLEKINLYDHTINCATSAIEIFIEENTPQTTANIVLLLALLHDFGKEERLFKKFNGDTRTNHCVISSRYARSKFSKYVNTLLSKEELATIAETLEKHHNKYVQETEYLRLLKRADGAARQKEEEFIISLEEDYEDDKETI